MTSVLTSVNIPSYDEIMTTGTPGKKPAKDKTTAAKKAKKTTDGEEMKKRSKVSNLYHQIVCSELFDTITTDAAGKHDVVMVDEISKQQLEDNQAENTKIKKLLQSENLKEQVTMQNPYIGEGEKQFLKENGYCESSDAVALGGTCNEKPFSITHGNFNAESSRAVIVEGTGLSPQHSHLLDEKCNADEGGKPTVPKLLKSMQNMSVEKAQVKIENYSPCFSSTNEDGNKAKYLQRLKCFEAHEKLFKELKTYKNLLDEVEGDDTGKLRASVSPILGKIWNEQLQIIIQSRLSPKKPSSSSKEMAATSPAPQSGNTSKMIANATKPAKKCIESTEIWMWYGTGDANISDIFDVEGGMDLDIILSVKNFLFAFLVYLVNMTTSERESKTLKAVADGGESEEENKGIDKKNNKKRPREEEAEPVVESTVVESMPILHNFQLNAIKHTQFEKIFSVLNFAIDNFVEEKEDGTQDFKMKEIQQYIQTNILSVEDGSGYKLAHLVPDLIKEVKNKKFDKKGKLLSVYDTAVTLALKFGDDTGCMKDIFLKMQKKQQQGKGKPKPDAAKPEPKADAKRDDTTSSSNSPQEEQENETPENPKDDSDSDDSDSDDDSSEDENEEKKKEDLTNKIKGLNAKSATVGFLKQLDQDARAIFKEEYPAEETTAKPKKANLLKRLIDFGATLC